jgi:hypothetical protein
VFFALCAGTIMFVPPTGNGLAGSFPLGCFADLGTACTSDGDCSDGRCVHQTCHAQVDATSFVPGYTIVYAFDDGRTNHNPVVDGLDGGQGGLIVGRIDHANGDADAGLLDAGDTATLCPVSEASRQASGCNRTDPAKTCAQYNVTVDVDPDGGVAEIDPGTRGVDGGAQWETVWVDYFADQGDIDTPVLLVNDATTGLQPPDKYTTKWTPPPAADGGPVTANLWAVVHDSRGGQTVAQRTITVVADAGP